MWLLIVQKLLREALMDIVLFPVWWYTRGAMRALHHGQAIFADINATLAPTIWVKHIFVPMFGQYDWQGRVMSFFIRLANIIVRFFLLGICLFLLLLGLACYLLLPVALGYGIITSLV